MRYGKSGVKSFEWSQVTLARVSEIIYDVNRYFVSIVTPQDQREGASQSQKPHPENRRDAAPGFFGLGVKPQKWIDFWHANGLRLKSKLCDYTSSGDVSCSVNC